MTMLKPLLFVCALGLSGAVLAQDASVTISSPVDGAKVGTSEPVSVAYEVVPGPNGNHVHLYVDDSEIAVLRQLKGTTSASRSRPAEAGPAKGRVSRPRSWTRKTWRMR